ncbi:hypothetical protein BDA96_09G108000 [Sorghum bicolor]|uniref:Uncharacterized protein n=1 Tax=Sorghum bicolor TaxID=4558 RepID=A0A921U4C9_SORBI|nr:hypothetical protein BDA96_09G108000 [Sorghum bicolor]
MQNDFQLLAASLRLHRLLQSFSNFREIKIYRNFCTACC